MRERKGKVKIVKVHGNGGPEKAVERRGRERERKRTEIFRN